MSSPNPFLFLKVIPFLNIMDISYVTRIDPKVNYNPTHFKEEIEAYLADPDGWVSQGYRFRYTTTQPRVVIELTDASSLAQKGCYDATLSCAEVNGRRMYLNANRWIRGAPKSKLELKHYRQYMVTHEMGHILGHDHVRCLGKGQPAPLMMQQTLGIGQCKPNTKLTEADITKK